MDFAFNEDQQSIREAVLKLCGQFGDLFFELDGVSLGIKSHALNQPNLITNRIDRITSAGFSSR